MAPRDTSGPIIDQAGEIAELQELLLAAEQRLAEVPNLRARIGELELELKGARAETAAAREEAQRLDQMLMYGRRMLRHVRPLIGPLRQARRRLHR